MRRPRPIALAALAVAVAIGVPGAAAGGGPGVVPPSACLGATTFASVPHRGGPPLRFGISPLPAAGQLGPVPATPVADQPRRDVGFLRELRAPGRPFVLRLTRLFSSSGTPGIRAMAALARRFTAAGFEVEIQVRYHPTSAENGDVPAFVAFVRHAVAMLGPIRGVVGFQVTNEVNFTISSDSSDGAYKNAPEALVDGVLAAKEQVLRHHLAARIGFNYFYRSDPSDDQRFWSELAAIGGERFAHAVDWVGLDVYPGTVYPPAEAAPDGYADTITGALSTLRECYLPIVHIGMRTPIYIEETGWPTGPGRSDAEQASVLRQVVGAVDALRGTYHVTDLRWFDLRDADSSSPNFQQQYGLVTSAYVPKPAFGVYRSLVRSDG